MLTHPSFLLDYFYADRDKLHWKEHFGRKKLFAYTEKMPKETVLL